MLCVNAEWRLPVWGRTISERGDVRRKTCTLGQSRAVDHNIRRIYSTQCAVLPDWAGSHTHAAKRLVLMLTFLNLLVVPVILWQFTGITVWKGLLTLCIFYICYYLKTACDGLWFIMWLSHHHLHLVVISVFQRYKTDFSTSIGWYINIISVNEITVFNCKFKLKP